MKKLFATAIAFSLTAMAPGLTAATSATPSASLTGPGIQMDFSITNPKSNIEIANNTQAPIVIYIAVESQMYNPNYEPANINTPQMINTDPVTVSGCVVGNRQTVQPGSMIACQIQGSGKATISIDPNSFKNGSAGVYSTN